MLVYIIITAILIFMSFFDHIDIMDICNKFFLVVISFILICISGLRFETGHDYYNYINIFNSLGSIQQYIKDGSANKVEWGYAIFNLIVKKLGGGPQVMFFIMALLTVSLFAYYIKKYTKYYFTSFLMFYFLLYFENTMGHIRAGLAMGIVLCAIQYIEKQDFIKFCVFILLAASFHSTALVVFPVYFIRKFEISNKVMGISLVVAFLIGNINIVNIINKFILTISYKSLLTSKFLNYVTNEALSNVAKTVAIRIVILILFIITKDRIGDKLKCYKTILYMYYFGVVLLLLLLNSPNDFAVRGTRMLVYVQIFILPSFLSNIKNLYIRLVSHSLVILYGFAMFFSYMSSFSYAFFPYKDVFMK